MGRENQETFLVGFPVQNLGETLACTDHKRSEVVEGEPATKSCDSSPLQELRHWRGEGLDQVSRNHTFTGPKSEAYNYMEPVVSADSDATAHFLSILIAS